MSTAMSARAAEVGDKLVAMRHWIAESGAGALRLRGIDWFAWATAGGSGAVLYSAEAGVAEVLVTAAEATVLTDENEAARLRDEQLPPGFTVHATSWAEPELRDEYVLAAAAGSPVLSDRPACDELALPHAVHARRVLLGPAEQQRYRELGVQAAAAIGEALRAARPDWTEFELAGAAAQALWRRGVEPAMVLAAGAGRFPRYRHPTPSAAPLGERAMLAICARRHGLHASLARFACFGQAAPSQSELLQVEATALDACVPGQSLSAVYHALEQGYRHANQPDAIGAHDQGGVAGYRARELLATDHSALRLEAGMAVAFSPGFGGQALEDTFLIGARGLENLTFDPSWPALEVQGRLRPLWLEAAC